MVQCGGGFRLPHKTPLWGFAAADGTTLVGWVKRDELKPAPPRHEQLGEPFLPAANCKRELPPVSPAHRMRMRGSDAYAVVRLLD